MTGLNELKRPSKREPIAYTLAEKTQHKALEERVRRREAAENFQRTVAEFVARARSVSPKPFGTNGITAGTIGNDAVFNNSLGIDVVEIIVSDQPASQLGVVVGDQGTNRPYLALADGTLYRINLPNPSDYTYYPGDIAIVSAQTKGGLDIQSFLVLKEILLYLVMTIRSVWKIQLRYSMEAL